MGVMQYLFKCLVLSYFIHGVLSLQCPVCTHVTVTDLPDIIKKPVDALLKPFQDEGCIQELEGPTPEIQEETCKVEPGKVARCSWYNATLTIKVTSKIPILIGREFPFRVIKRGCYDAPVAAIPSNGCHDLENLNKSEFRKIIDELASWLNIYNIGGQICLSGNMTPTPAPTAISTTTSTTTLTEAVGMASLCSQMSSNLVVGIMLIVLMFKYV